MKMELRKTFQFEAAHLLPLLPKAHKCRRLHGHSFKVDIVVAGECGFDRLADVRREDVESWLVQRKAEGMSARTRNSYLQAIRGLCNWCVETGRLAGKPLAKIAKADEKADRRRTRRALTEDELRSLGFVNDVDSGVICRWLHQGRRAAALSASRQRSPAHPSVPAPATTACR